MWWPRVTVKIRTIISVRIYSSDERQRGKIHRSCTERINKHSWTVVEIIRSGENELQDIVSNPSPLDDSQLHVGHVVLSHNVLSLS